MNSDEIILELKNIHKTFGANHIHRGINIKLHAQESVALLGGSGTGKSVLLRSIIGLEHIDNGNILYKGKRIDNLSEQNLIPVRIKISYAFQNGALFDSLTVFDNIAYPLFEHTNLGNDEIQEKVTQALDLVDLHGKEELMPSDLSGGMQKRVGLARSMIMGPEIILYDEPTAGLDPSNTKNIIEILKNQKRNGIASIFVTHDIPSALQVCDRILILDSGQIGYAGTPQEFLESQDPIAKKFLIISNLGPLNYETKRD